MTRDEKAALRAQARRLRRHPQGGNGQGGPSEDGQPQPEDAREEEDVQQQESEAQEDGRRRDEGQRAKRERPHGAAGDELAEVAAQARGLLRSLRGVEAESVSGITRTPSGWQVTLEVLELRRIPESTDVLATYEVELDEDSRFLGFSRGRRYHRSQAEGAR